MNRRVLISLGLCHVLLACNDDGSVTKACTSNEQCQTDQVCNIPLGRCETKTDTGCPTVTCGPSKTCCKSGEACRFDQCIPTPTACEADKNCQNDTYCENKECIPWGLGPKGNFNASCQVTVPLGVFSPALQCAWSGPEATDPYPGHKNVYVTPTVVDFDLDGDPKVRKPSIVIVTDAGEGGGSETSDCVGDTYYGVIRVLDGESCTQQHVVEGVKVRPSVTPALADLNLDGRPEIVAGRCGGGLVALTYNPQAKKFELLWTSKPNNLGATGYGITGPSIHDLDDDGKPEILFWGTVWSNTGELLDGALGQLPYSYGLFPVAADLDGDKQIELTNGAQVWKWLGGKWTQPTAANQPAGHVAVADFGTFGTDPTKDDRSKLDGIAEIAVVSSGSVRVQTIDGRVIFGPVAFTGGGTGGPPTIGDFDKDGRVEVAVAAYSTFSVFDPDCVGTPDEKTCASKTTTGILWAQPCEDYSSNMTGSSLFDFDGDGTDETVYADECFTRVYAGKTGEVLFSQYHSSCTWMENPVVADVDGDFKAEIVVPNNTNCGIGCATNPVHPKHPTSGLAMDPIYKGLRCMGNAECPGGTCDQGFCRCTKDEDCANESLVCGPPVEGTPGSGNVCRSAFKKAFSGIQVFKEKLDRWVSAPMIWNQHAYSVTHVNENGTIPKTSDWKQNWKQPGLNNFRQNAKGGLSRNAGSDLTVKAVTPPTCDGGTLTITAQLCNRGAQGAAAGTSVTFYAEAAAPGKALCTAKNAKPLDPGSCETVTCTASSVPQGSAFNVVIAADDPGTGVSGRVECEEGNNGSLFKGVSCAAPQQ
ncbi:MAG: VCBS repeat-containing protein [Deltaproteobacteria bacterium]|nr:VCBS repeat-containing protein [Deltaproteobacteria bacterium]